MSRLQHYLLFVLSSIFLFNHSLAQHPNTAYPIPGNWYGWGAMQLEVNNGSLSFSYSDTWDDDDGYINMQLSNGVWEGQWGEQSIDRRGIFNEINISPDGRNIQGIYSVVNEGEMGGMKEDVSFHFYLTDEVPETPEEVEDTCVFPDISGIWHCENKGYFDLSQRNLEKDGDCVSIVEGKFVRFDCTDDFWSMTQDKTNYVRGKIVNGAYELELYPVDDKEDIYASRERTTASGTITEETTSLSPALLFGLTHVKKQNTVEVDPHTGEKVIQMEWVYPPVSLSLGSCTFSTMAAISNEVPDEQPCASCMKRTLPEGISFDDGRFTSTSEKYYRENNIAVDPRYAVGSGIAQAARTPLIFTSDLMNSMVNSAPRFNITITNVEREGKYIDVFYELCDWKTGELKKLSKTHQMDNLTKAELMLPDDDTTIQQEYRKAGAYIYTYGLLKEINKE